MNSQSQEESNVNDDIKTIPEQLTSCYISNNSHTIKDNSFCVIKNDLVDVYYRLQENVTKNNLNVFVKFSFNCFTEDGEELYNALKNAKQMSEVEKIIKEAIKNNQLTAEKDCQTDVSFLTLKYKQEKNPPFEEKKIINVEENLTTINEYYFSENFFKVIDNENSSTITEDCFSPKNPSEYKIKKFPFEPIFQIFFENHKKEPCKELLQTKWISGGESFEHRRGILEYLFYLRFTDQIYRYTNEELNNLIEYFETEGYSTFLSNLEKTITKPFIETNKELEQQYEQLNAKNEELKEQVETAKINLADTQQKKDKQEELLVKMNNYYNTASSSICFSCVPSLSSEDIEELNGYQVNK
jgi:hypothetical protein